MYRFLSDKLRKKYFINIFSILITSFCALFFANIAYAANASFYLSPESGVYTIGDEFPVSIMLDTDGKPIVAAEGNVTFNKNELEVVGVSKDGSILTQWTIEPEYSNEEGMVYFGGALPSGEEYNGEEGKILTIVFKAMSNIASNVRFSTGAAILAADSSATNILTQMNSGVYTLNAKEVVPTIEYVAQVNTSTSTILSATHPDQGSWYANSNPEFSWTLSEDIENIRIIFDEEPLTIPTIFYSTPVTKKTIENVEDGTWYFHLQTKNDIGWGEILHYKVQIDTVDPKHFEIIEKPRPDLTDPNPAFIFEAFDELSGVGGFEVSLDDSVGEIWRSSEASSTDIVYSLEDISPGKHTLAVKAVDKAGNHISQTVDFAVDALEIPQIINVPKDLIVGGMLALKGTTYSDSEVVVWIEKDGEDPISVRVLSDSAGNFIYVLEEGAQEGVYGIWVQAKNIYGAQSESSAKSSVYVEKPGIIVFGSRALSYLSIIVPLVGLVVLLFVFLWYGWNKFRTYKRHLRKEVKEAESVLHKEFSELKRTIQDELYILEHKRAERQLTPEEERILRRLGRGMSQIESKVGKEFEDIRKITVAQDEKSEESPKQTEVKEQVQPPSQIQEAQQARPAPKTIETNNQHKKMQIRIEKLH